MYSHTLPDTFSSHTHRHLELQRLVSVSALRASCQQ